VQEALTQSFREDYATRGKESFSPRCTCLVQEAILFQLDWTFWTQKPQHSSSQFWLRSGMLKVCTSIINSQNSLAIEQTCEERVKTKKRSTNFQGIGVDSKLPHCVNPCNYLWCLDCTLCRLHL
jgi:hypothetical protein